MTNQRIARPFTGLNLLAVYQTQDWYINSTTGEGRYKVQGGDVYKVQGGGVYKVQGEGVYKVQGFGNFSEKGRL